MTFASHSGTTQGVEPGIHFAKCTWPADFFICARSICTREARTDISHQWIPGSLAALAPRNDELKWHSLAKKIKLKRARQPHRTTIPTLSVRTRAPRPSSPAWLEKKITLTRPIKFSNGM